MSSSQARAAMRAGSRPSAIPWTLFAYLAIGLLALLPRVLDLGTFVTEDEANFWIPRSSIFLNALRTGDFAATAVTDHPGVTTMWLGSAGILLRRALFALGLLHTDAYPIVLTLFRLPVVVTHVVAILLGYALMRRLLPAATALLAALLWAFDPFVIAYSKLLHVDALAATFATLSVLAACCYWHHTLRRRWLVLSAVCAGLSILSKSPGIALFPTVGGIALAARWRAPSSPWHLGSALRAAAVWGLICSATIFALWPALWVSPIQAYTQIRIGVAVEARAPHALGNFFLGHVFLGHSGTAPGWLFYPVTLALRLTPWTLFGVLVLPLVWWRLRPRTRHDVAALALYVVLFTLAMSLFPKKFNRYLVPVFPALDILAAVGLVWAAEGLGGLGQRLSRRRAVGKYGATGLQATLVVAALLNVAYWHPYEIAAFNQLLGGARAGAATFMVGWGEGFEQVAAWLNQQPDITRVRVASPIVQPLQPYLRPGAQAIVSGTLPDQVGYVVEYVRFVQGTPPSPPFDQFYGRATPLQVIRIHGVDYAWIYQAPPAVARLLPAQFGPTIRLRGYRQRDPLTRGQPFRVALEWEPQQTLPASDMLFVHLLGPDGRRYAQVDLPYAGQDWQRGRYWLTELPLALPADAPAGTYRLVMGIYDPATGQRLHATAAAVAAPALDGPDALLLGEPTLK